MWKLIMDKLNGKNLNPYPPGKHKGICEERYCIVKENSQVPKFNTNRLGYRLIDIIIFVPLNSYIQVEPYANEIREVMKEIKTLRKTGNETPVIVDDKKEAYTMSIEYMIQRKLEG